MKSFFASLLLITIFQSAHANTFCTTPHERLIPFVTMSFDKAGFLTVSVWDEQENYTAQYQFTGEKDQNFFRGQKLRKVIDNSKKTGMPDTLTFSSNTKSIDPDHDFYRLIGLDPIAKHDVSYQINKDCVEVPN